MPRHCLWSFHQSLGWLQAITLLLELLAAGSMLFFEPATCEQKTSDRFIQDDFDRAKAVVDKNSRPSPPTYQNAFLGLWMKLYHIVHVDDRKQLLELKARVAYSWRDSRLAWAREPNITTMKIRLFEYPVFWTPVIKILQAMGTPKPLTRSPAITEIHRDGRIYQLYYVTITLSCAMRMGSFPVDRQSCPMTFYCHSCYLFNDKVMPLHGRAPNFLNDSYITSTLDDHYSGVTRQENNIFDFVNITSQLKGITPIITITMKRRSAYYFFYMLSPSALLIPATDAIMKIGIGMSCLVAMNIVLIVVKENVSPDVHGQIPIISQYFGAEMLIITAIITASVVVVHLHDKGNGSDNSPPSRCVMFFCLFLAKAFCLKDTAKVLHDGLKRWKKERCRLLCKLSTKAEAKRLGFGPVAMGVDCTAMEGAERLIRTGPSQHRKPKAVDRSTDNGKTGSSSICRRSCPKKDFKAQRASEISARTGHSYSAMLPDDRLYHIRAEMLQSKQIAERNAVRWRAVATAFNSLFMWVTVLGFLTSLVWLLILPIVNS